MRVRMFFYICFSIQYLAVKDGISFQIPHLCQCSHIVMIMGSNLYIFCIVCRYLYTNCINNITHWKEIRQIKTCNISISC